MLFIVGWWEFGVVERFFIGVLFLLGFVIMFLCFLIVCRGSSCESEVGVVVLMFIVYFGFLVLNWLFLVVGVGFMVGIVVFFGCVRFMVVGFWVIGIDVLFGDWFCCIGDVFDWDLFGFFVVVCFFFVGVIRFFLGRVGVDCNVFVKLWLLKGIWKWIFLEGMKLMIFLFLMFLCVNCLIWGFLIIWFLVNFVLWML